jgi:hypothetical protein
LTLGKGKKVRPVLITSFERGRIDERREIVLLQLELMFGPLTPDVRQRVEALSFEDLRQLLIDLVKAQSLKELRLAD